MPSVRLLSNRIFMMLIVAIIPLLEASCTYSKFPPEWTYPTPSSPEVCTDISGTYKNIGDSSEKRSVRLPDGSIKILNASLRVIFFEAESEKNNPLRKSLLETTHISIQLQDHSLLRVTAYKDKVALFSKDYSRSSGDLKCDKGWLTISASRMIPAGADVFGYMWTTIYLAKSDKFLIVREDMKAAGLCFCLFPMPFQDVRWGRFQQSQD